MRIGLGYDVHRLVEGRPLILGGVQIPFSKGLLGHSDADVLLHAISDALLGAIGRALSVGVPFDPSQVADESFEGGRVLEVLDPWGEGKFVLTEGLLEAIEELAPDHL